MNARELGYLCGAAKTAAETSRPPRTGRKRKGESLVVPGGLMLAGLGSLAGASALGSSQQFADAQKSLDLQNSPLAPHDTAMSRYADSLAPGARLTPFGHPVGKLLAALRANPSAVSFGLVPEAYASKTPGDHQQSLAHYDFFRRGPLVGWDHQLRHSRGNVELSPDTLKAVATDPIYGGKIPATYGDAMKPYVETLGKNWLKSQYGTDWMDIQAIPDTNSVPHAKQMEFFKHLEENLPEHLRKERHRVETDIHGPSLKTQTERYLKPTQAAVAIRNSLLVAGGGAAGAGLGYWAGGLGDAGKDKTKARIRRVLGAVLGGGLGAAAGWYAGDGVRDKINNALAKWTSRRP